MANIDLITGFLGAGKTTFIRKYAQFLREKGESFAVIENEYGSKGIDSKILRSEGIATDELFGGCICCTLKVGFHDMLLRLSGNFDRIIVEPSGVYDISQFYAVTASPGLKGKCNIGNVICVVDPDMTDRLDVFSVQMLKRQIMGAGCVVFSMHDDADENKLSLYTAKLSSVLGIDKINVIGYTDFEKLYGIGCSDIEIVPETLHSSKYLSTLIKAESCSEIAMRERIDKLFKISECGEVLRVKGVWGGKMVNAVSGMIEIFAHEGEEGINIIGVDLNRKIIKAILKGNI